jgi:phosphohistidine phosphatase
MNLILWRHAEAEDPRPDLDDLDRQLTPIGHRQAKKMAKWLNARLPEGATILSSPAIRARQTASVLDRTTRVIPSIPPGTDPKVLCKVVGWPDAGGTVILVGHQPELGELAATLLAGAPLHWSVRKGSVWWFHGRTKAGVFQVILKAVIDVGDL